MVIIRLVSSQIPQDTVQLWQVLLGSAPYISFCFSSSRPVPKDMAAEFYLPTPEHLLTNTHTNIISENILKQKFSTQVRILRYIQI